MKNLCISLFLLCAQLNAQLTASALPPQAKQTRQMNFPSDIDCGRLYRWHQSDPGGLLPESDMVTKPGKYYISEARGKVKIPTATGDFIYLVPSYALLAKPERISELPADSIDCLAFASTTLMVSIEGAVAPLTHLRSLRKLEMSAAELTDAQIEPIGNLPALQSLAVVANSLHGNFIRKIKSPAVLQDLDLSFNPISAEGFRNLPCLQNLVRLKLNQAKVDDSALVEICKLKKLQYLGINQAKISARSLGLLTNLPDLRHLTLVGTGLKAADLTALHGLPKLKGLDLPDRAYSSADFKKLQGALPGVNLVLVNSVQPVDNETKSVFAPLH